MSLLPDDPSTESDKSDLPSQSVIASEGQSVIQEEDVTTPALPKEQFHSYDSEEVDPALAKAMGESEEEHDEDEDSGSGTISQQAPTPGLPMFAFPPGMMRQEKDVRELESTLQDLTRQGADQAKEICKLAQRQAEQEAETKKRNAKLKREAFMLSYKWIVFGICALVLSATISWACLRVLNESFGMLIMLVIFGLWILYVLYLYSGVTQMKKALMSMWEESPDSEDNGK